MAAALGGLTERSCASGDTIAVSLAGPVEAFGVLLSVDDTFVTLPTKAGFVGYPTALLTAQEARWLASELLARASLIEKEPIPAP